jgi:hypothetical protein
MSRREIALATLGVGAVLAALGLAGAAGALGTGALTMLPALLLAAALFAGRYPGEQLLGRWAGRRPSVRRTISRIAAPARRCVAPPRGGRLVAAALAGRAPPALPAG